MSKDKIKLVITHPCELSQRWVSYYCLDELCKHFDVEFWDCSEIVKAYTSGKTQYPVMRDYLVVIKSLQMFKNLMHSLPKDTILITEIHYNQYTVEIHKIQSHCFPAYAHINFYANTQLHLSERSSGVEQAPRLNRFSLFARFINKAKKCFYQIPMMQEVSWFILHHGDSNYKEQAAIRRISKWYTFVWELSSAKGSEHRINHPDYQQYLHDKEHVIPSPNIVFIDNYFPYHPEISYCEQNLDVKSVAKSYYASLNPFFDKLEKTYDCNVVIASHPSSIFKDNPFAGRQIYYGETSSLIRDCRMVCMHTSNAFSYVVLYDKPVALITNNAFNQVSFQRQRLAFCGEHFSLPIIDIDKPELSVSSIFSNVNADIRYKYIDDYLADLNLSLGNAELFRRYLIEFHDRILCGD